MHCLSSVYFVIQPLHVSGMSVAHLQEIYCVCNNWYVLFLKEGCLKLLKHIYIL